MPVTDIQLEAAIEQLRARLQKCNAARECAWALTDTAIGLYQLPDCVTYLLNADGQTLTQVAAFGPKMKVGQVIEHAVTLRVGQGIVGSVAFARLSIRINDTRRDPRYVIDDAPRLSELAIPIVHERRLLGVLDMEHEQIAFFDAAHEVNLSRLAALTGARLAALADALPTVSAT